MIGLTAWRDSKIANLESTIETYRERNKQLEAELVELKELRIKCKIQQMLIDDDQAIDEMLACRKEKESAMIQQQRMALSGHTLGDRARLGQLGSLGQAHEAAMISFCANR